MPNQFVGQERWIIDRRDRSYHFGRNLLVEPRVVVKGRNHRAHQRFDLGRAILDFLDLLGLDLEIFVVGDVAKHACALLAFDQRLHGAVRQPKQLHDHPERPDRVQVSRRRLRDLGIFLSHQQDRRLLRLGGFQSLYGFLAADEDWIDFMRKNDQFSKRKKRNDITRSIAIIFFVVAKKHLLIFRLQRLYAVSAVF